MRLFIIVALSIIPSLGLRPATRLPHTRDHQWSRRATVTGGDSRSPPPARLPAYEQPGDEDELSRKFCEEHGLPVVRKNVLRGAHAGREYWGCAHDVPCEHFEWLKKKKPKGPAPPRQRLAGDDAQRGGREVSWADAGLKNVGLETLNGTLTRLLYRSEDGYTVVRLSNASTPKKATSKEEGRKMMKKEQPAILGVRAVSCLATARVGESHSLLGRWSVHPRFGRQFEAVASRPLLSEEKKNASAAFATWLGSGVVGRVGTATAAKVVLTLGDKAEEILVRFATARQAGAVDSEAEAEIERLVLSSAGLSRDAVVQIAKKVAEEAASRAVIVGLLKAGAPSGAAFSLFNTLGASALAELNHDPHAALLRCPGWGFPRADALALTLGARPDSPTRLRCGLVHALGEASVAQGHTAQTATELIDLAAGPYGPLATFDFAPLKPALQTALRDCLFEGSIKSVQDEETLLLLTPWMDHAERTVAKAVHNLCCSSSRQQEKLPAISYDYEDASLSEEQRSAVEDARRSSLLVLVGGPGTGKTRTARSVVVAWRRDLPGCRVALAAPTARGAAVLGNAIGGGYKATTIHRLLEWSAKDDGFSRGESNPLDIDAVVVDEASMLDVALAARLLASLPPKAKLLFIGDPHQLPSVGPGALLRDLLQCPEVPRATLSHIYRTSSSSSDIALDATLINQGQPPSQLRSFLKSAASSMIPDGSVCLEVDAADPAKVRDAIIETVKQLQTQGYDPLADIQILAPMKRGHAGTASLNKAMQSYLLGDDEEEPVRAKDRVIQLTNDHEIGVFNGDVGVVDKVYRNGSFVANFAVSPLMNTLMSNNQDNDGFVRVMYAASDLDDTISLAYALTVHKAQGAEYPVVIMPVVRDHFSMLQRPLLYTALTRAKRLLILVGSREMLNDAVKHCEVIARRTALTHRITRNNNNNDRQTTNTIRTTTQNPASLGNFLNASTTG